MNRNNIRHTLRLMLICISLFTISSCSSDDPAPTIDSVWYNMVTQPIEQAPCAYPGQTLCIHGSGFGSLRYLIVNGTYINLNNIMVYASDNYITFQLPSDVNTGDLLRVVTARGKADYTFPVRPTDEQPTLYYDTDTKAIPFSSTMLVPGTTLTIRGTNLSGVKEVYLPLAFDGRVKCEFDETKPNTDEYIYVIVPDAQNYATGYCEVVMEKTDAARGIIYTEKIYSKKTDFTN